MKPKSPLGNYFAARRFFLVAACCVAARMENLFANPAGMTVGYGSATAQQNGSQLNVTTSQAALLNWSSFDIQQGETTTFIQPSVNSVVLNEIGGANPSQIFGHLNANGTVILANANGFYFGPNSMISVGGSFIATTAPLAPDFGAGSAWTFTGMPPLASIVNYGQVQVGSGKSLFLIAEQIDNHGELNAPGGNIGLCAGQSVLVSERPDGRGLSATVKVPSGAVNNLGQITADAGTIALQAQVVNQNGIIQADAIRNQNGVIELVAADSLNLGADSQILARGDNATPDSSGGTIALKSGNNFNDYAGGKISVAGGAQGGDGGSVEISAKNLGDIHSLLDGSAQTGFSGGKVLIDPTDLALDSSSLNPYSGFANILFQADGNITLAAGTAWNLSSATSVGTGQLTLLAGGDITFGSNAKIADANNWSVTLEAGYNSGNGTINSGVGNIYLNGGAGQNQNGTIQLSAGAVNLFAGQSILVGSGSVFTTGGGSIYADALAGDVNAGTANGSSTSSGTQTSDYLFTASGSRPNAILGGISTKAGGDVTLIAGNNVVSVPTVPSSSLWPGASGTYGAGNVTIIAGNQISGNYNLANGIGNLLAGVQLSSGQAGVLQNRGADPTTYAATLNNLESEVAQNSSGTGNIGAATGATGAVTLSLIKGSWNAWAANNIYLNEVNNPNGTFNQLQSFLFNYAPDAAANLWAGNGIELVGGSLTRVTRQNQTMPPIYAPMLSLNAGAGGITIDKTIILYPSSAGALRIVTRNDGNLSGAVPVGSTLLNGITMSDSGSANWKTFATGHAATPLHVNDPNPVTLDISGDINSFGLTVPTFAQINVAGNTYNFGFVGQNLSAAQITAINVAGNITYRGNLTSEILSAAISSSVFEEIIAGDPALAGTLRYNAASAQISFVGLMDSATELSLLDPTDVNGNAIFAGAQLAAWHATITQLYSDSQSAALGDNGLVLSGPGKFDITAKNIDLGISSGIGVAVPDTALAAISPYGANINVTTFGNLEMTSTEIANDSYLGGVNLHVGGTLDVGGQLTAFGDPNAPKGIFTTSGGNVSVTANGNVNVDGSRIAAYNGGNVDIKSVTGDVNAGTGGAGYVTMNSLQLDSSGQLISIPATIPGSGILATTIVGADAALGNITINAPNGSVNASLGGIIQIAFNGNTPPNTFVEVNAGHDINAKGSGIIGSNIKLQAGGNITGLVIGSQSININSAQNVDVTAFSGGDVNINASGEVSGTVISGGNVDVSGEAITASLIASSVSTSGDASGATEGIPQSNVAKDNAPTADDVPSVKSDDTDDELKKKGKGINLAQKVSRVTVILPVTKRLSEKSSGNNPL